MAVNRGGVNCEWTHSTDRESTCRLTRHRQSHSGQRESVQQSTKGVSVIASHLLHGDTEELPWCYSGLVQHGNSILTAEDAVHSEHGLPFRSLWCLTFIPGPPSRSRSPAGPAETSHQHCSLLVFWSFCLLFCLRPNRSCSRSLAGGRAQLRSLCSSK